MGCERITGGFVCSRGRRSRPQRCVEHPDREAVALCDFPEAGPRARTCSAPLCAECARPWCEHLPVQPPKRARGKLDLCPRHHRFARREVDLLARGEVVPACGCPGHHARPVAPRRCPRHGADAACAYIDDAGAWRCAFDSDPRRDVGLTRRPSPRPAPAAPSSPASPVATYDPARCNVPDPTKCPRRGWRGPCVYDVGHPPPCSFESVHAPAPPPQAAAGAVPTGRTRCFRRQRPLTPPGQLGLFGAPERDDDP